MLFASPCKADPPAAAAAAAASSSARRSLEDMSKEISRKRNMLASHLDPDQEGNGDVDGIRARLKEIYLMRVSTYSDRRSVTPFESFEMCNPAPRPSPSLPETVLRDMLDELTPTDAVIRANMFLRINPKKKIMFCKADPPAAAAAASSSVRRSLEDMSKEISRKRNSSASLCDPDQEEGNGDVVDGVRARLKEIYLMRVSTYSDRRSVTPFESFEMCNPAPRPSPSLPETVLRDMLDKLTPTDAVIRANMFSRINPTRRSRLPRVRPHHPGVVVDEDKKEDDCIAVLQRDLVSSLKLSSSDSSPPPPLFRFPWDAADTGTDGYAIKILSMNEIVSKLGITDIIGEFVCRKCHLTFATALNLKSNSMDIAVLFSLQRANFVNCMPDDLHHPKLSPCPNRCGFNLEPVIPAENNCSDKAENNCSDKAENNCSDNQRINWLFLFLGKLLGCCSVEQLDFFCKHSTSDYQTGAAKGRLLYLTYITLIKQLYPSFPVN